MTIAGLPELPGFEDARRIVVCAKEAGAGAYLAALLVQAKLPAERMRIFARPEAAVFFEQAGLKCTVVHEGDEQAVMMRVFGQVADFLAFAPDLVLVGASAGASPEKALILEARRRGVPVYSFVDHYWNLWQRFAHEQTAERWFYLPDRIYVLNESLRARLVALGCPPEVAAVHAHPVLAGAMPVTMSRSKARGELKIPDGARVALYVSEYVFAEDPLWKWDQPSEDDIRGFLAALLQAAAGLAVVVIKLHPAESVDRWDALLGGQEPASYRVVKQFDKSGLFEAADVVFGLNSMLVLEAMRAGKLAYSFHPQTGGPGADRSAWLSEIESGLVELGSVEELEKVLRGRG